MKEIVADMQIAGLTGYKNGTLTLPPVPVVELFFQPTPAKPTRSRRGRKGKGEHFYAQVARTYVKEVGKGKTRGILEVIRKQHRLARIDDARAAVYRARQMGLLGGRQPGKVSGFLTDKAKAVLAAGPPKKKLGAKVRSSRRPQRSKAEG